MSSRAPRAEAGRSRARGSLHQLRPSLTDTLEFLMDRSTNIFIFQLFLSQKLVFVLLPSVDIWSSHVDFLPSAAQLSKTRLVILPIKAIYLKLKF